MVFIAHCTSCSMGDHSGHIKNYLKAPPGVMGGAACLCPGDCAETHKDSHEELMRKWFGEASPEPERP